MAPFFSRQLVIFRERKPINGRVTSRVWSPKSSSDALETFRPQTAKEKITRKEARLSLTRNYTKSPMEIEKKIILTNISPRLSN